MEPKLPHKAPSPSCPPAWWRGRGADNVAVEVQLIDILGQLLAPELAAESEADATSRELEQLCRVDVQIEGSQLRRLDVFRMHGGKVGRRRVGWNGGRQRIAEGIEGTFSLKYTTWLEDGIVLVQNSIETRGRDQGAVLGGLHLAVTESEIITPRSIKQFVASGTERHEERIGRVVEETVAKFEDTSPAATRDDLIERIKRVEGVGRYQGVLECRGSRRRHAVQICIGGMARVTWPAVWNEPVAEGANSSCEIAFW